MRRQTVRVALQPGERITHPVTGASSTAPMAGTEPMVFEIHSISANEILDADRVITEAPPKIFQDEPNPKGVGSVSVMKGYDHDDPDYISKRQAQVPRRNAMICLFGCPALAESTPGTQTGEKIEKLLSEIPGVLLDWLCEQIETISILSVVGDENVSSFLAEGSEATPSSSATKPRSPAGEKSKRSKDSKEPTSPTKPAKRRTTGG